MNDLQYLIADSKKIDVIYSFILNIHMVLVLIGWAMSF